MPGWAAYWVLFFLDPLPSEGTTPPSCAHSMLSRATGLPTAPRDQTCLHLQVKACLGCIWSSL